MKFSEFVNSIPKIEKNPLPGETAQLLLSPDDRPKFNVNYRNEYTREASVMALLYPKNNETHIALILRTTYDGAHSGQVAFPGGKTEPEDQSHWHTALRETEEEIGVQQNKIQFIKAMTSIYIPPSNFRVFPFLATAEENLQFKLQPEEVEKVIEMPIKELITPENTFQTKIKISKTTSITAPAFGFDDHKIWGATAMMLSELKQLLIKSVRL